MIVRADKSDGLSQQAAEPVVSALTGFDPSRIREVFPLGGFAPGNYMGKCRACGREMWNVDKRALSCFDCAVIALKKHVEALDSALRIRIWNDAKAKGLSDDLSMSFVAEQMNAIAMEARQGRDGETRLDPKDDSAGPQDIAQLQSPTPHQDSQRREG